MMNSTLFDVRRDHLFLEQELQPVGERLQQAERPDAVGPDAVLHPRRELALQQDEVRARRQDGPQGDGDRQRA